MKKRFKWSDEILVQKCSTDIPYTILPNSMLGNTKLSFEAKGLLSFMLSVPMNWKFTKTWIMDRFDIGKRPLNRCFLELEENGYLQITEQPKDQDGRFQCKVYRVFPHSKKYDDSKATVFNRGSK